MADLIENRTFTGERALYKVSDLAIRGCTFEDGESHLKHARNLKIEKSTFGWKYPLWHSENIDVADSTFTEGGRAGIWYTKNISLTDTEYAAAKGFRKCEGVSLKNVNLPDAKETLWWCRNISLKNVSASGDYFFMNSSDIKIDGLVLNGNYPFDGCKNIEISNSRLESKDAFWNSENVIVRDSVIVGQYLAWNSKNVTFINCTIESEQGLCYTENLTLKNCRLVNTNLAFEYSTVEAELTGSVLSIKNPAGGRIKAEQIDELILDDTKIDPAKTKIVCPKILKRTEEITDKAEI